MRSQEDIEFQLNKLRDNVDVGRYDSEKQKNIMLNWIEALEWVIYER